MRLFTFHRYLIASILALTFISCYIDNETGSSSNDLSFENSLAPLLSSNCAGSGCHSTTDNQGDLNLELSEEHIADDIFKILEEGALLDTKNPEDSVLLLQASNTDPDTPHTGGEVFATSSSEYASLLAWIEGGALNDDCTNVEHGFSENVVETFNRCNGTGCHPSGASLDLTEGKAFSSIQENNAVNITNPIESNLLQYGLGRNNHSGGEVYTTVNEDDFKVVFCWIKVDEAAEN